MIIRTTFAAVILALAAFLSGCGSSSSGGASPTPSQSTAAAATPSQSQTVAANLDPCQLVTASEASHLAGTTYASGREETSGGGGKICVYGYQTLNVFMVIVSRAADAATAQAAWSDQEAKAKTEIQNSAAGASNLNFSVTDVSLSGADRAAVASATNSLYGRTIGISAIYVLKGATFFTFSDLVLGHAGPSSADMETQAQTVLGRV